MHRDERDLIRQLLRDQVRPDPAAVGPSLHTPSNGGAALSLASSATATVAVIVIKDAEFDKRAEDRPRVLVCLDDFGNIKGFRSEMFGVIFGEAELVLVLEDGVAEGRGQVVCREL